MRVLVAYSMSSGFTATTRDYVRSFGQYLPEVSYLHVTEGAICDVDLDDFDAVINSYCARFCYDSVSKSYRDALRQFQGVKVIALQDEYNRTNATKFAISDLGFNVVLTCVADIESIYPQAEFPNTRFQRVLTGYVPERFKNLPSRPLSERQIVVGYRGRDLGPHYGRLGFEKMEIGRRMKEICNQRGIQHDIAFDESSRIYGPAWFDFIGSCRAILGTESGCNVFDFDGSLEAKVKELRAQGHLTYEQFASFIADRETKIDMAQISPRIFEYAAMRTPMVLFKGRYSDLLKPDQHYISLEKDFSNVDEVLDRLNDVTALGEMAERAYRHVALSDELSYRAFVETVACLIRKCRASPPNGRAKIVVDTTLSEADRLLIERPTPEPKTSEDFETLQYRIKFIPIRDNFIHYRDEVDRLTAAQKDIIQFLKPLIAKVDDPVADKAAILFERAEVDRVSFENLCNERSGDIRSYASLPLPAIAALFDLMRSRYGELHESLIALYAISTQVEQMISDKQNRAIAWVRSGMRGVLAKMLPANVYSAVRLFVRRFVGV